MDIRNIMLASLVEAGGVAYYRQRHGLLDDSMSASLLSYHGFMSAVFPNFVSFFVVQYFLTKLCRIFIWPHYFSPLRRIPGPKPPFYSPLGNMPAIVSSSSPIGAHLEWSKLWPTSPFIRFFSLFNQEILIAVTPEAFKEVWATHCYEFKKPDLVIRMVGNVVGTTSVLFIEGQDHRAARKRLNPIFSGTNVKKLLPMFQQKAGELTQWFERRLDENGVGIIDVAGVYSKMTIDIIGASVMGVELGNLSSTDEQEKRWDFLQCYGMLFEQSTLSALLSFISMVVPIRWIPLKANRDFISATTQIRKMTTEVVRNRMRDLREKRADGTAAGGYNNLLTMMIEDIQNSGQVEGLGEQYIVDEMLTFLLAGHETSAGAMVWATYALAIKPSVQEKLRAEILTLFDGDLNRVPTMGEIESLRYLNCFTKEVLRLYSPAIFGYREALNDMHLCGQFIPKGTIIMMSPHMTNRSEHVWGPDVNEFLPERWEKMEGPAADPFAMGSFIHGPRVCVGKQFALIEFKTLLIELVPKFRIGISPQLEALRGQFPQTMNPGVAYRPRDGLDVRFERI